MSKISQTDKIILGIDPGTTVMGYGIIQVKGKELELESMGIIQLSKYRDHMLKLKTIFERTLMLIEQYKPDEFAIETQFYGKNIQSMLKLGRAQGIAIAAALYRDIPIFEYEPKKIKQSITGNGNASKEQVGAMLARIFHIEKLPRYLDATDGLAVALTHYYHTSHFLKNSKSSRDSGWHQFLRDNPERIK